MSRYVAERLVALVPVLLVVATVGFFLIYLAPGEPAAVMLGPDATAEDLARVRHLMGHDQPIAVQLARWYGRLAQGDLGESIFLRRPVAQAIRERLEPTLLLTALALAIAVGVGVPAGIIAAARRDSWWDQICMTGALLGISVPSFWLGLHFILFFSVSLGWFPVAGYTPVAESPVHALRSLALPALTLGAGASALIARMTRSSLLEVLGQEYVRTARAKGNPPRRVLVRHALTNALVPTITVIGLALGGLLTGAVAVETVFALPGVGRLVISSVLRRDYPVVQGVLLFMTATYVVVNLIVDLLYTAIDPRIRYA